MSRIVAWKDGEVIVSVNPEPYGRIDVAVQVVVNQVEAMNLKNCKVLIKGPKDIFEHCRGTQSDLYELTYGED